MLEEKTPTEDFDQMQFAMTMGQSAKQRMWDRNDPKTWSEIIELLTNHQESDQKDGACFAVAKFREPYRRLENAEEIGLLALDVDGSHYREEIRSALEKAGCAAVIYSTFNHGGTQSTVSKAEFERHGKGAASFLTEKKKYHIRVADGAQILRETESEITIGHQPCPKYRVVIPLMRAWRASDFPSQEEAVQTWRERYLSAVNHLGLIVDDSCADPNRLFYSPRHPKGAQFEMEVVEGDLLDIWSLAPISKCNEPCMDLSPKSVSLNTGIIDAFNQKHSVSEMLEKFGYEKEGDRYLAPSSSTGEPGVAILDDGKVYSHHGSDPLNTGHAHDAFSIHCILGYSGNLSKAVKAAAESLGLTSRPINQQTPSSEYPFRVGKGGVYFRAERDSGEIDFEWVCSPLIVKAMTRNVMGEEWGRLLEITDPDNVVHSWAMPMSMTAGRGDEYRARLKSLGLRLAPGRRGNERLDLYLNLTVPPARVRCVSSIGWHDGMYVLPDLTYGLTQGEEVVLQAPYVVENFRQSGTLEEWKHHIGRFCIGNSRLVFAVSCAFAPPLLHLVGLESGGFHFHGKSSSGKTTTLRLAGSVCGECGLNGYVKQWRATDNALEGVAAGHCDALLCLDELSQADAKSAAETAYMLANGQGKGRATREGGTRNTQKWRLLFLSNGEITLSDKIQEDGKKKVRAGQLVRIVDIPAEVRAGQGVFEVFHGFSGGVEFSRYLYDATSRYYGTPYRAYLEKLLTNLEDVAPNLQGEISAFCQRNTPAGADGQIHRVAARFGLVAIGGELAAAFGVVPWPLGEATQAAEICFRDWLASRGGTESAETTIGIAQVRAFIETHGSSRFEPWEGSYERTVNRAGFWKENQTGERDYFILPTCFKGDACKGFNSRSIALEMLNKGLLFQGEDGKTAKSLYVPTLKAKARLYHISGKILQWGE